VDAAGALTGIITDGDLRRHWARDMRDARPTEIMTRSPRTVPAGALASAALATMTMIRPKITVLFVIAGGKPIGILHIHDLLKAGVA
jgi:arabinose-5-phosphate isomerase